MISSALSHLWATPAAPSPPARVWRDWVLLAVVLVGAVLEGTLRSDVPWRPVALVLAVGLSATLMWRRTRPLATVLVAFGTIVVTDLVSLAAGTPGSIGLGTMGYVLVLVYALYRWGSGRQVVLGTTVILVAIGLGLTRDYSSPGESVLAVLFAAFPAVLGSSVRFGSVSRSRKLDEARLLEREQLARELHDTVAHHVSAMVIRAQAGQVVAAVRQEAAVEALAAIEVEGSRTLAEMRVMVGTLRGPGEIDLAPQRGVADLERLARTLGDDPPVELELAGDLADLGPAVGAAVYRIVQESLTNAVRHARHATRVVVRVVGEKGVVRCTVTDDGDPVSVSWMTGGYGLVGMTERAALLGGTIELGPGPDRGWVVDVVLPRTVHAR